MFILREIILLNGLRKLYPMELCIKIFVQTFVYFHTMYVRAAKALVVMCRYTRSFEFSLLANVISTKISRADPFMYDFQESFLILCGWGGVEVGASKLRYRLPHLQVKSAMIF